MSNQSKAVFKYALALIFLFTHAVSYAGAPAAAPSDAACDASLTKDKTKKCDDAIKTALAHSGAGSGQTDIQGNAAAMASAADIGKALDAVGKEQCGKVVEGCQAVCAGMKSQKTCDKYNSYTQELAAGELQNQNTSDQAMETQAAATSNPGGGGDMMGMLMGAGIGGLMGYMIAKKMNEDKEKQEDQQPDPDSALLPTGQLDCSKGDAYMYGECNAWLEANCAGSTTPNCKKFENRYCSSDPKLTKASGGFVGEGIGTPFCKNSVAVAFCKVQGRAMCPSCLGLARNNSAACQQDPSLCLAQNSPDQINEAKKTCPTDPAFADPNYVAGGGAQVPGGLNDGSLPAVVLPQSVAAKAASAAVKEGQGSGISTASVGGKPGVSAGSVGAGEGAVREGAANGGVVSASGGAASYGASASGAARAPASKVNYRTASADGRPSDVEGPFGPSLFKTSTEVIKSRCDAGKLNNCP